MKPFRTSGKPVQEGFLGTRQDAVTVLDPAGQHRQSMGFEFGQTDDDIRLVNRPGNTDAAHVFRMERHPDGIVADIGITPLSGLHQPRLPETLLIGAIVEKPRIIPHQQLRRVHGFDFFHHRLQEGRVRHDPLVRLGGPQHVGFDENLFLRQRQRKNVEDAIHDRTHAVVAGRFNQHFVHAHPFLPGIDGRATQKVHLNIKRASV